MSTRAEICIELREGVSETIINLGLWIKVVSGSKAFFELHTNNYGNFNILR